MRVISNTQPVPNWMKPETTAGESLAHRFCHACGHDRGCSGHPVSIFPDRVQDALRVGQDVPLSDLVPVPTGRDIK